MRKQQILEDITRRRSSDAIARTEEQIVRDNIALVTEVDAEEVLQQIAAGKAIKRKKEQRPEEWETVARHAMEHGDLIALEDYSEVFEGAKLHAAKMRLKRWKEDVIAGKKVYKGKPPAYGIKIDQELLKEFDIRRNSGLPVDDSILRTILMPLLIRHGMTHLLRTNQCGET